MAEVCTAPVLKAVGPQVSPLSPGQALDKIMQPPGKGAKLGKSSHVLTTSRSMFPAQFVEVLQVDTPELFQEYVIPHHHLISATSYSQSFIE